MQVLFYFLKLGSHWTLPRDCTVGTPLGRTTRGILEGFPGRVLSDPPILLHDSVLFRVNLHRVNIINALSVP